jgi:hypothetical protein
MLEVSQTICCHSHQQRYFDEVSAVLEEKLRLLCLSVKAKISVGVATLQVSKGTAVQLSVTFLAADVLHHMHATEGSYNLIRLDQVNLHLGADLGTFRSASVSFYCTLLRLAPLWDGFRSRSPVSCAPKFLRQDENSTFQLNVCRCMWVFVYMF